MKSVFGSPKDEDFGPLFYASGNVSKKINSKGIVEYVCNELNQLIEYKDHKKRVIFTYNGQGERLSKEVNGKTTFYSYDDVFPVFQVLEEQREEKAREYFYGLGPLSLDITNRDEANQIVQKAGDTQILINNAGFAGFSGFCFNYSEETARQELEVNYWGLINLIRAFCKTLIKNQNGAIANVISIGGLSSFPLCATYSASKAAAHSLTQSVRAELTRHGISVFGVYPGPIDTDMADGLNLEKETPANAAIRIFDGMEQGIEDITTDGFADSFIKKLRLDPKEVEKDIGDFVHQMPEDF